MNYEEVIRQLEIDLPELNFSCTKLKSLRELYEIKFTGKKTNDKNGAVIFDFGFSNNDGFYENIKLRCQNWRPVAEATEEDKAEKKPSFFKRGAKKP